MSQTSKDRKIRPEHLKTLRRLLTRFRKNTNFPEPDNWRQSNDENIWRDVFAQVIVVGRAAPVEKFLKSRDLRRAVSYKTLCKLSDSKARAEMKRVLRKVGARYHNRKTDALLRNLRFFQNRASMVPA